MWVLGLLACGPEVIEAPGSAVCAEATAESVRLTTGAHDVELALATVAVEPFHFVPEDGSCPAERPGLDYPWLSAQTGGPVGDFCAEDYAPVLLALCEQVSEPALEL